MSLDPTILELANQIAYLQSQNAVLEQENKILKDTFIAKAQHKQAKSEHNIYLENAIDKLKQKRLDELEIKYADELTFIRKRYPRWKPNIKEY